MELIGEHVGSAEDGGCIYQIHTGLVKGNGVEAASDTQIRHDSGIVVVPAIAFRTHIHDERHMEMRLAVEDRFGIFINLIIENRTTLVATHNHTFALAERDTLSATYAFRIINLRLAVDYMDGIVVATVLANLAADALVFLNPRLSSSVHVSFACYTTRPHADILERTTKSGLFMALEMRETDEDIRLGNSCSDMRLWAVFALDIDDSFVFSAQAIGNDHIGPGSNRIETIHHSRMQVVHGIMAAATIERIGIGEKRLTAQFTNHADDHSGIVRTDIRQVAVFAKMNLYGNIFVFKVDFFESGLSHHIFEFLQQTIAWSGAEIGEIHGRGSHTNMEFIRIKKWDIIHGVFCRWRFWENEGNSAFLWPTTAW